MKFETIKTAMSRFKTVACKAPISKIPVHKLCKQLKILKETNLKLKNLTLT